MTAYRCIKFIKHNGVGYDVGASIELTEPDDIAHLEKQRAIESLDVPKEEVKDLSEELCKVDGITKTLAKALIEQGIKSVDQLGVLEIKELEKLQGISKRIAEKIFNSFVAAE